MTLLLDRGRVFPEVFLPDPQALIEEGRNMARQVTVGRSPFLETYGVPCEAALLMFMTSGRRILTTP